MSKANIFLILPETKPRTKWSISCNIIQDKNHYNRFISSIISEIELIKNENYEGYFDNENLINFFEYFDSLEDYYPKIKRNFIIKIQNWLNWRLDSCQNNSSIYQIFNQNITNHTLPEIAQRKEIYTNETFCLLNKNALSIQSQSIRIIISTQKIINIDNILIADELQIWFSINRIPVRNFHIIEKHPINLDSQPRIWRGRFVSYLHCSEEKAKELLQIAIGLSNDELFAFDNENNEFIVFKYENENPQNMYHGYHIPINSIEIPSNIKNKLLS